MGWDRPLRAISPAKRAALTFAQWEAGISARQTFSAFWANPLASRCWLPTALRALPRRGSFRIWHCISSHDPARNGNILRWRRALARSWAHIYTFWLRFKGGKGIATSGGVVMAWAPLACVTALATWGILLVITRFVSVASIAAAIILPFAVLFWDGSPTMTYVMAGISLLAIYKHKGNIQRLLKGERKPNRQKEILTRMKVTVIGAGAWGTALANLLRHNRHSVTLWGHNAALLEQITATGRNDLYLPQIVLAPGIRCQADLQLAVDDSECVVLAVPSKFFREVTSRISTFKGLAVSVTKGIEAETGLTMTGILNSTMPQASAAVLSGPSLALEVAREIPAAVVAAHRDHDVAKKTQELFHRTSFRVYTAKDAVGVELGGAVKNVIAIAAGVGDGLGFGDNSKAGLVTRGVAEMRRLGLARGASADTFPAWAD